MKKVVVLLSISLLVFNYSIAQNLQWESALFTKEFNCDKNSKEYVTTLKWCSDNIDTYVGLLEPATLAAAVEFDSNDLNDYIGNYITELEIAINNSEMITSAKVFIIENPATANENVVVEQNVFFSNNWNTINITQPYEITGDPIFVGYEVVVTGGRPLCTDEGPGNPKSRWVRIGGEGNPWEDMIGVPIDKNFSIKAIVDSEGTFDEPIANVSPTYFNAGNIILNETKISQEFSLSNIGVNILSINSISYSTNQTTSSIVIEDVNLEGGQSYSFNISFTPNTTDYIVDTLFINTNSETIKVPVYGQGVDDQDCMLMNMELPGNLVLYEFPGGNGYVSGNNTYGHQAIADFFEYPLLGEISLAFIPLGYVGGASGTIDFVIWEATNDGPGEAIFSQTVSMAELYSEFTGGNEVEMYTLIFNNTVEVNGDFYFGAILPTTGDDFAFLNTDIDLLPNTAWLQDSNGQWQSYVQEHSIALKNIVIPEICPIGPISTQSQDINQKLVNIFPNPASDYLKISNVKNQHISIYNLLGLKLNSIYASEDIIQLDMRNYPNGTYLIEVNNKVYKVIITR